MPDKSFVTIHLSAGTAITEWCDSCLLPSVVVVPLHVIGESGVRHIATYRRCQDCATEPDNQPEETS